MSSAADPAAWLRVRFAALVLAERPGSVLDVGSGAGDVLERLAAEGVRVGGVDRDAAAVQSLRARGFVAERAAAEELPFPDAAFDHVALRHVLHHLPDERPAAREALRVARHGVVLAEPWFDARIPSQRVSARVTDWVKELHRREGRVHRTDIPAAAMIDALHGAESGLDFEIHHWLRLRPRPIEDLDAEVEPLLDAVGGSADRAAYDRLRGEAREHGLTWNGSVAIVARRGRVPASGK